MGIPLHCLPQLASIALFPDHSTAPSASGPASSDWTGLGHGQAGPEPQVRSSSREGGPVTHLGAGVRVGAAAEGGLISEATGGGLWLGHGRPEKSPTSPASKQAGHTLRKDRGPPLLSTE